MLREGRRGLLSSLSPAASPRSSYAAIAAMRRMTVQVPEESLQEWKLAAAKRGVSLAEWVRRVLNATAQATVNGK